MKRLLFAAVLIAMGAHARKSSTAAATPVSVINAEDIEQTNWPTLDKVWFKQNKNSDFVNALIGTPSAELKLGYEYSDVDNGIPAANALIGRIRLNYQSGVWKGFDGFVQAQYVGSLVDNYSSSKPPVDYDVVADPEAFRFHQAYLGWTGYDTKARIGSQEIILDNARFIGNVGWRFNAQSFNAGLIQNQSVENLKLFYSYIDSINAPDGDTKRTRQYHLVNVQYDLGEEKKNKVSAYSYLQRNDNADNVDTFGLRSWGKNGKIAHNGMLAFQRDAYYGYLSGALDNESVDFELGGEYISGGADPKERFQTLNGTAHAFNGWADQFLGTGGGLKHGLVDIWAKVSGQPMDKMTASAIFHYFNTAKDVDGFSGNYGSEIDAQLKYAFNEYIDTSATIAYHMKGDNNAENKTNDETVFWLRGALRF